LNTTRTSNDIDPSTEIHRSVVWVWLSRVIVAAGIVWVVVVFTRDFASLRNDFRIESFAWLGFTFVAGMLALLLTVPVFQLLLRSHSDIPIRYSYAARLLFVAQVLRHLPGRVWGVMYLIAETRRSIPTSAMVRANIDVMLYSMSFSMLVAILLYVSVTIGLIFASAAGILALSLFAMAVHLDWIGQIARMVSRFLPERAAKFSAGLTALRPVPWNVVSKIVVCYILSWACYLSIWWALTKIFVVLEDVNIWLLCAAYSVAWVLGYISMITPAGLGVREAGFFALAAPVMSLPNLTFLAVFVRVWQLTTELLLFFMFAFAKHGRATDNTSVADDSSETHLGQKPNE